VHSDKLWTRLRAALEEGLSEREARRRLQRACAACSRRSAGSGNPVNHVPLALGQMLDVADRTLSGQAGRRLQRHARHYCGAGGARRRLRPRPAGPRPRPGDHVVLWMPNSIEWNVVNFAIAKIGAVTVTCNSRYKALELAYLLQQSDAKALVMVDPVRRRRHRLPRDPPRRRARRPVAAGSAYRQRPAPQSCGTWLSSRRTGSGAAWAPRTSCGAARASRPASWRRSAWRRRRRRRCSYTSGTTGAARGCVLVARQLLVQGTRISRPARVDGGGSLPRRGAVLSTSSARSAASPPTRSRARHRSSWRSSSPRTQCASSGRAGDDLLRCPTMFITMLGHPHFRRVRPPLAAHGAPSAPRRCPSR